MTDIVKNNRTDYFKNVRFDYNKQHIISQVITGGLHNFEKNTNNSRYIMSWKVLDYDSTSDNISNGS